MIRFHLSAHSGTPAYLEIVQQVKQALRMGIMQEGDQLPTIKEVVAMLAVNPNTVFKAYRELESMGLVEGKTGSGTFALRRPQGPPPSTHVALSKSLSRWLAEAHTAGLDEEAIEALVRNTLNNSRKESE